MFLRVPALVHPGSPRQRTVNPVAVVVVAVVIQLLQLRNN